VLAGAEADEADDDAGALYAGADEEDSAGAAAEEDSGV